MRTSVDLCDLCIPEGEATLATVDYKTSNGKVYSACPKHEKEVVKAGFVIIHYYARPGDVDPELFQE